MIDIQQLANLDPTGSGFVNYQGQVYGYSAPVNPNVYEVVNPQAAANFYTQQTAALQNLMNTQVPSGGSLQSASQTPAVFSRIPENAQVVQAGVISPQLLTLLGNLVKGGGLLSNLPTWAQWLLGGVSAAGGIAGLTSLFGGNGANGGSSNVIPGTDIGLGGPGAPEPSAAMIAKEWGGIGGSRFYLLINGRVVVRRRNGTWKLIRRPKMLHMKTSNPRMGDVVKADRIVARTAKILRRRLK